MVEVELGNIEGIVGVDGGRVHGDGAAVAGRSSILVLAVEGVAVAVDLPAVNGAMVAEVADDVRVGRGNVAEVLMAGDFRGAVATGRRDGSDEESQTGKHDTCRERRHVDDALSVCRHEEVEVALKTMSNEGQ